MEGTTSTKKRRGSIDCHSGPLEPSRSFVEHRFFAVADEGAGVTGLTSYVVTPVYVTSLSPAQFERRG